MGWPCMELGHRKEIVSQTVLIVERKEGGFERESQIRRGAAVGGGYGGLKGTLSVPGRSQES